MTAKYQLTPAAEQDVVDIYEYVWREFGERVAERVFAELEQSFRRLSEMPEIGRTRPELAPKPWLMWPVGPSLIAYRVDGTTVQIARIVRSERDWDDVVFGE